jgi:flagellar hook-basal body complex protein FliE
VLSQVLGGASQSDAQANEAIAALASGEADDVHSAVLAVAQADLGFRLALEIRNRMLEAFQEVSRLQV